MDKKQFIEAGKIINTHGVAGEVKMEVWLDSPAFLKSCGRIYIGAEPVKMLSAREHKGFLIAKLEGINDVNAAMALKGREFSVNRSDAKLPKGRFFIQDIIGAAVIDDVQGEIGTLTDVMETPASRIYVVNGEKEHLIPAVPEFILSTDAEAGIIKVHLIEGM